MRFDNKLLLSMTAALVPLLVACPATPPQQEVPKSAVVKLFSASPAEVGAGEAATLSWEVEDAKSVSIATLDGAPIALPDATASRGTTLVTVQETTVYVLTAHGEGGHDKAASSVLVRQKAGSIFCTVAPQEVEAGDPVTVVWNAAGASQITVTNAAGEEIYSGNQVQGSKTLTPSFSTTFTCAADSKTASTSLQVSPKILAFGANSSNVAAGGTVALSWKVGGAQSVSLIAEGRGALTTTSTAAQIADGSYTDTVPANLPANGFVTYRLEASAGETKIDQTLEVYVGAEPRIVRFDVPAYAREASVFNVEWTTQQAHQVVVLVDGQPVHVATTAAEVASGLLTLPSPEISMEVALKVTNTRGGEVVSPKHTVYPVGTPVLNGPITVTPPVIATGGEPATISWNVTNARRVRVLDDLGKLVAEVTGMAAEVGSVDVYTNKQTDYTVEIDNSAGDAILPVPTVSVGVTSPATLTWAAPLYPAGGSIVLGGHTGVNAGGLYGVPNVVKNAPGEAFIDIRQDGTPVNVTANVSTSTYVRKFGAEMDTLVHGVRAFHDSISVNVNGYLVFSSTSKSGSSDNTLPFPSNQLVPLAIAPYFDDLRTNLDGSSEIYFRTDGSGLNRRLIVQWDNFKHDDFESSLTFQAQIYESGKIVFAYKTLQGVAANDPAVGVINSDETGGLVAPDFPAEGDTYTFFGPVTPPVTVDAIDEPLAARLQIGATDLYLNISADPPAYLAAGQLTVSEVNVKPAAGVTDGQWIEISNNTANPFDLTGWELDIGGNRYTLPGLSIPANGQLVLGQSAAAAEGFTVDHAYGTGITLPEGGTVALLLAGQPYTRLSLPLATLPAGYTWHTGALAAGMTAATGVTQVDCTASSTTPYGTTVVQYGTPGQPNTACPNYNYTGPNTGGFASIAGIGTELTFANEDDDAVVVPLQRPINLDKAMVGAVVVSTNGYLTFDPTFTCPQYCYSTNKTAVDPTKAPAGLFAPFWDDIDTTGPASGVFVHYFPATAPTADDGYTVISWENVYQFDQPADRLFFQAKFFDNGNIEYHYGEMTGSTGETATIWFEHPSGNAAFVVGINAGTIQPNTGYQLTAL